MASTPSSGSSRKRGAAKDSSAATVQERRAAQRERIRKEREAELRRQRNVRTIVIAAMTVVALVLVGGLGYAIWSQLRPAGPATAPSNVASGQAYLSYGAPADSDKPVVEIHLDFMCPFCGEFDKANAEDISTMIENQEAQIHMVPRRFLDAQSTTGDYSTRAANAYVCMYEQDPKASLSFQQLLFENQPEEGSAGLSDEQIRGFAEQAGATEETLSCLEKQTYRPWVRQVVEPYAAEKKQGTPYVEINGTKAEIDRFKTPGELRSAVLDAGGAAPSDAGGASDGGQG